MKMQSDGSDFIPVVSADNERKRKKNNQMKFLPLIIAAVLIAVIVITVVVIRSKKSKMEEHGFVTEEAGELVVPSDEATRDTSPVTFSEDVEVTFDSISMDFAETLTEHAMNFSSAVAIKPEERPTVSGSTSAVQKPKKPQITTKEHLEATTVVTTEKTQGANEAIDIITAFFNRKYYFDGEMIAQGEKTPLEIAMNGSNFQLFSEMEGKDISIMNFDSKIYLLNPDTKKYSELSASFQKMMGIDASQFSFEFNNANFDGKSPNSVTKAQYKEQEAVCYTYKNEKNHIEFIAVSNEIKQMTLFDAVGNAKTILVADEFSSEIPDEMLNFKGYSKTNMISFMASLM